MISEDELRTLLASVSQRAFKHWLKTQEVPHTATNLDDLLRQIVRSLEKGRLTEPQVTNAIREIEESGGKRVFLRRAERPNSLKNTGVFEKHLESLDLAVSATESRPHVASREPSVVYVTWRAGSTLRVRIRFSETHKAAEIDYAQNRVINTDVAKVVVAVADIDNHDVHVQVRMDSAERIHSHLDSDSGAPSEVRYEDYYLDRTREILGCNNLELEDLGRAARILVEITPRIFELPSEKVRTGANSWQKYSSRGDVRDDPARKAAAAADGKKWVFEDIQGYWVPERSRKRLQRRLFMQLKRRRAMLRFLADCLEDEADYAVSTVRSL